MSAQAKTVLRLGTRGSMLARVQSGWVACQIERRHPSVQVQLIVCKTTGDKFTDRPLHNIGGKGLFTKELEEALLEGRVDFVVHSMKDVPVTMPLVDVSSLIIAAVPAREDPRDVLVTANGQSIDKLPIGDVVGTGSLRRRSQLLALRPDLIVRPLRGNIDTRLKCVSGGEFDAVVLAAAGLRRSGLYDSSLMSSMDTGTMLPAAAQGALALQCRTSDEATRTILARLDDPRTHLCVDLERDVVQRLNGDCHSPIAVFAEVENTRIRLRAAVGGRGGQPNIIRAEATAEVHHRQAALNEVMRQLVEANAPELLAGRQSSERIPV